MVAHTVSNILQAPQKEKIKEKKPGEKCGQEILPTWTINFSMNLQYKAITSPWKCGATLSCWNRMSSGPSSSEIHTRNFSNMSRHSMTVTVKFRVEKRPEHFLFAQRTKHINF
jgi:hypothetical protein